MKDIPMLLSCESLRMIREKSGSNLYEIEYLYKEGSFEVSHAVWIKPPRLVFLLLYLFPSCKIVLSVNVRVRESW